ncbi:MAG: hypothetical protein AB1499_15375 [Nitrospirota bacterium]
MKEFLKKFENAMAAAAFAEAGEDMTARQMLDGSDSSVGLTGILRTGALGVVNKLASMACTFAKAGDHEAAVELLEEADSILRDIREKYRNQLTGSASK